MEAIATIHSKLNEVPKFKVLRKKVDRAPAKKILHLYPKVIMPEQPTGYIRQRKNDCW